ncbi:MAG TPA: A24 family peptidase [Terriglobales bacterium]
MKIAISILAAAVAAIAGVTDWRSRRIPNWLTVPALGVGIAVNTVLRGWPGAKDALLGAALGLLVLLPFVLIRSLGAGDWKLAGALGAFLGPNGLLAVLFMTILIAGAMALALVIWRGRLWQTLKNIGRMLGAFFSLHLPGGELTLDDPKSTKVPFGVAMAVAAIVYTARQALGAR